MTISNNSSKADAMRDETIGELDDAFFANARVRQGSKVLREAKGTISRRGRPPMAEGERKEAVSLRLSPKVLAHFRATGSGWQTRIDDALQELVIGTGRSRATKSASTGKRGSPGPVPAGIVVHEKGGRLFGTKKEAMEAARKIGQGGWIILKDAKGQFKLLDQGKKGRDRKSG
jgi:uncharacterized protein (DUF4415 family)